MTQHERNEICRQMDIAENAFRAAHASIKTGSGKPENPYANNPEDAAFWTRAYNAQLNFHKLRDELREENKKARDEDPLLMLLFCAVLNFITGEDGALQYTTIDGALKHAPQHWPDKAELFNRARDVLAEYIVF